METTLVADAGHVRSEGATITVSFEPRCISLKYKGAIINESMVQLIKTNNQMIELYQPEKIVLTLDSPGGEVDAMHLMKFHLDSCKAKGIEIETRADATCASAAAVIFSLGAIGSRYALPITHLLFHNPRVMPSSRPWLEHHLTNMGSMLEKSRKKMNQYLTSHLTTSLGQMGFAQTLKTRAQRLLDPVFLNECEHLSLFSAGSIFPLDEMTTEFEEWADWKIVDNDSANALVNRWENNLQKLNALDGKVDLRCAWGMLLIDETDSLPPICIKDFRDILPTPVDEPVEEPMQKHKP